MHSESFVEIIQTIVIFYNTQVQRNSFYIC